MLRASLILSVLVGLGIIGVSQFLVAPKVQGLRDDNARLTTDLNSARDAERKARSEERRAKEERDQIAEQLTTTQDELEATAAKAFEQEKRANELAGQLATTQEGKIRAERELNKYMATGVSPEQITSMYTDLKKTIQQRDVFSAENQYLTQQVNGLKAELDSIIGTGEYKVPLPEGLKGTVLEVDSDWDFVVLDIGSRQGVIEKGEMLVNRSGNLVAKVKITSVMENRSIANVLSDWKQVDVSVGDQVVY